MSDPKNRFNLDSGEYGAPVDEPANESRSGNGNGHNGNGGDDDYASPEKFEQDKFKLVDFLQFPKEKRRLSEFLQDTYKSYENENVERLINRVVHEHDSEMRGATPYYKPGHIGSLMYEYLNMIGVEAAFVSGLQHTKSSMTKTVQQRVDEINTLLRGVGGFNRQIKASFSRSAVVYLEQEDPHNKHRERVMFTVNLGDFELRYPMSEDAADEETEDGRSLRRLVWDEAVNTLAEIVSNTGMKPKYVKNDKNSCVFTMRQYLLSENDKLPDEYFTFDLRYLNAAQKEKAAAEYTQTIENYNQQIADLRKKAGSWFISSRKRDAIQQQLVALEKDRDFYIGTRPDPREMDVGLIFSIFVNTLKDYSVTKDKMQVIMTKYILALSRIAVDKSMDQQVSTVYQHKQAKPKDFQSLGDAIGDEPQAEGNQKVVVMKDDLVRHSKKSGGSRFRA